MKIQLGVRARDKITGLEGTITARAEYLESPDMYCLEAAPFGTLGQTWLSEGRLELIKERKSHQPLPGPVPD